MNDIVKNETETSHFHKFETLQAGQYWRARADYPDDGIDESLFVVCGCGTTDGVAHQLGCPLCIGQRFGCAQMSSIRRWAAA